MELFRTNEFYIFVNGEHSLWWDRQTGAFIPKTGWDLTDADDPYCLGIVDGLIGKVEHPSVFSPRLLLIKESLPVGRLHGENVYKVKSVVFLPLGTENIELGLNECPKHKTLSSLLPSQKLINTPAFFDNIQKNTTFTKTWGTLKSAGNTIRNTTQQAAAIATGATTGKKKIDLVKDKDRFERQIIDEFYKIFTDTNSFYYSHKTDLTNSLQRLCKLEKAGLIKANSLWRTVDDRFFWNKFMLKDLIELDNPLCDPWILPIIQGYIQIEDCKVILAPEFQSAEKKYELFTLCILSRRSRFRAGTRYKRRGVNENGECANYVETEQLISYQNHEVSFVQVRGSVPVYWSQPGYKYRPPPRIDKGDAETTIAFEKHFTDEIQKYGPICVVNLIDQSGKERIIFDAYSNYILKYNSPFITYVTFDFHEYCRGMHFENVSILINALTDVIKDMNYCWRDKQGHICSQNGIFRVNCIDCLDRTNVVQTAIGKAVMEIQFCKLGLISPEGIMPSSIKNIFQLLWANNGDTISKQYAGTNALKGDYTRTGERKFTGIMKDGMNSANRYYLSRFKDATRQGTIDLMLGEYVSEELFYESKIQNFEEDTLATAEHVKLLIEDCKKMLINQPEYIIGAWGLINADPSTEDPNETEMDTILILTKDSYFIADYDDQVDKITKYQRVQLSDIILIECGLPETTTSSLFKSSKTKFSIRINYKVDGVCGYYHMFRSTNLRFFNNMAVQIKSEEEEIESLKAICEAFIVTLDINGYQPIPYNLGKSLERRKSKVIDYDHNKHSNSVYLDIAGLPQITRNVSESQLLVLKNVGSKALSNVSQQFSKLNKIGSSFKRNKNRANFTIGGDVNYSIRTAENKKKLSRKEHYDSSSNTDDEDYEDSIFQPSPSITTPNSLVDSSSNSQSIEQGFEITEDTTILEMDNNTSSHKFLPSVGIVMGQSCSSISNNENDQNEQPTLEQRENLFKHQDSSQVDNVQLTTIMQTPEIQINSQDIEQQQQQQQQLVYGNNKSQLQQSLLSHNLKLEGKLSHSSGEVDETNNTSSFINQRSSSECDVTLNISQSQSESALKSRLTNITSPVANVTKDLVFSPFSKLAKGVQNLSVNFDPRKLGQVKQISEKEMEDHRKLHEKWQNSKTRLIAL